jgi:hypothetical protein
MPVQPLPANILVGFASTNSATIITIPANRVWKGTLTLSAVLVLAASAAAVTHTASVEIVGTTATPAAGNILGVPLSLPLQPATNGAAINGTQSIELTIAAGDTSATLELLFNSITQAAATASGVLIA